MNNDKQLTTTQSKGFMNCSTFEDAERVAKWISTSAWIPDAFKNKPHDIMVCMQMGQELDIPPLQALQGIAVINNRPSVWGDLMLAICRRSPDWEYLLEYVDETAMVATVKAKRRNEPEVIRTFSKQDAETARLWGKAGTWTTNPKRMLQMRARAFALRDCYTDVLKGLQSAEEMQDSDTYTLDTKDYSSYTGTPQQITQDVTPEQLSELREKIKAAKTDEIKMCDVLKIDTLDSMTPEQYNVILNIVNKRLEKMIPATTAPVTDAQKTADELANEAHAKSI